MLSVFSIKFIFLKCLSRSFEYFFILSPSTLLPLTYNFQSINSYLTYTHYIISSIYIKKIYYLWSQSIFIRTTFILSIIFWISCIALCALVFSEYDLRCFFGSYFFCKIISSYIILFFIIYFEIFANFFVNSILFSIIFFYFMIFYIF